MKTIRILFFEDQPYDPENRNFYEQGQMLPKNFSSKLDVKFEGVHSVVGFENCIKRKDCNCDVLILDIMVKSPEGFCWEYVAGKNVRVPDSLVGVELLRRCRKGFYGDHYKDIPIYMRTARGEEEIKEYCMQIGATGYFQPGKDDAKLQTSLIKHLEQIIAE